MHRQGDRLVQDRHLQKIERQTISGVSLRLQEMAANPGVVCTESCCRIASVRARRCISWQPLAMCAARTRSITIGSPAPSRASTPSRSSPSFFKIRNWPVQVDATVFSTHSTRPLSRSPWFHLFWAGDRMKELMSGFAANYFWFHKSEGDIGPRVVASYFNILISAITVGLLTLLVVQLGYPVSAAVLP